MKKTIIIVMVLCGCAFANVVKESLMAKINSKVVTDKLDAKAIDTLDFKNAGLTKDEINFANLYPRAVKIWAKSDMEQKKREEMKVATRTLVSSLIATTVKNTGLTEQQAKDLIVECITEPKEIVNEK